MNKADSKRPSPLSHGSNQGGMRQFNERVVLQTIRLNGSCSKAQIARATHLSAQTVQQIMGRLEEDGLVIREAPVRGKVGQPSVPMALNPDGAFSIGVNIGRRSTDLLLVDFSAQVRECLSFTYDVPDPEEIFGRIEELLLSLTHTLGPEKAGLISGIGVTAPLAIQDWGELLGFPPDYEQRWEHIDHVAEIKKFCSLPIDFVKDTAAACIAELVVGRGRSLRSFLYFYVDVFIGGGLVIDSQLHSGLHGNAGAVGSMPLSMGDTDQQRKPPQLLSVASLLNLEMRYKARGLDPGAWSDERAFQAPWREETNQWLAQAGAAMAMTINAAASLLDLEGIIIDGSFDHGVLAALIDSIRQAMNLHDWKGVDMPLLRAGKVGTNARALGGALLPLYANFTPNPESFLKLAP
ncbi:MAG: ROK family transcriptional regulator [Acidihalobacter sp.]|jgi:predicted NBD/HSP70 family sugar kinase